MQAPNALYLISHYLQLLSVFFLDEEMETQKTSHFPEVIQLRKGGAGTLICLISKP